jgi:hypothetical protein
MSQPTDTSNAGSGGNRTPSSSASAFLSTLVPVAAQAAVFVGIFLVMRTKKQRVYRPRTYLQTLHDQWVSLIKQTSRQHGWRGSPGRSRKSYQKGDSIGYGHLEAFQMNTFSIINHLMVISTFGSSRWSPSYALSGRVLRFRFSSLSMQLEMAGRYNLIYYLFRTLGQVKRIDTTHTFS